MRCTLCDREYQAKTIGQSFCSKRCQNLKSQFALTAHNEKTRLELERMPKGIRREICADFLRGSPDFDQCGDIV